MSENSLIRRLIGFWEGIVRIDADQYHRENGVRFEFRENDGRLEFLDHDRQLMTSGPACVQFLADGRFKVEWRLISPSKMQGIGEFSRGDDVLTFRIRTESGYIPAQTPAEVTILLSRSNPACTRFSAPRVTFAGDRDLKYTYRPPEPRDDGWLIASLSDVGIDPQPIEELVTTILAEPRQINDGILIARHGRLVFEEYFWGHGPNTAHMIASCTKSVASMLAGIAHDRGLFPPVDAHALEFFGEYPQSRWLKEGYPVSVGNLLSMTAGVKWNEDPQYWDPANSTQGMEAAADPIEYLLNLPLVDKPGAKWCYNSGLPILMGRILAKRTGEANESFADRELFGPLGIRNYSWARAARTGEVLVSGGLEMTGRDMLKLGQVMLSDGMWGGRRILSAEWARTSIAQHTAPGDYPYGYYWHITDSAERRYMSVPGFLAAGYGGQRIVVLPQQDVVIALVASNFEIHGPTPIAPLVQYILPAMS